MKQMSIMLASLLVIGCCSLKSKAQPPQANADTLQWLKTNIEQRNTYFSGKPLSVLLDSLYDLKLMLREYSRAEISDNQPAWTYSKDTVFTSKVIIFFNEITGGGVIAQAHDANSNVNTHVLYLKISFSQSIPFLTSVWKNPYYGYLWSSVDNLCRPYIVNSVSVGEY